MRSIIRFSMAIICVLLTQFIFAQSTQSNLNNLMDRWHLAASEADSMTYFDLMADDAYYIGTDSAEVWTKQEFLQFASPYFAKGKAWDFTKTSRHVHVDEDAQIAWFDEMLDTWMGPCRGSGVIQKMGDQWKIKHYVLSVTVENEDIQSYIKITTH